MYKEDSQKLERELDKVVISNNLKSCGVQDVLIFCTDNLMGISEAIKACYPQKVNNVLVFF